MRCRQAVNWQQNCRISARSEFSNVQGVGYPEIALQQEWPVGHSAMAQRLAAIAWRLRLAIIRAELRPVRTMMGHKKVQTMAHNTRLPRAWPPSAVSIC